MAFFEIKQMLSVTATAQAEGISLEGAMLESHISLSLVSLAFGDSGPMCGVAERNSTVSIAHEGLGIDSS